MDYWRLKVSHEFTNYFVLKFVYYWGLESTANSQIYFVLKLIVDCWMVVCPLQIREFSYFLIMGVRLFWQTADDLYDLMGDPVEFFQCKRFYEEGLNAVLYAF